MREGRDFAIINHINNHFSDLSEDLKTIDTFECFTNSNEKRRAILFDFLQIGELVNQLSDSFKKTFNNKDAERLIAIRNRIVHGYSTIRDDIIFITLKEHLPLFINQLNDFAKEYYLTYLKQMIGKKVKVFVEDETITNSNIHYGHIEDLTTLSGTFQVVYVHGQIDNKEDCVGRVINIIQLDNEKMGLSIELTNK